MIEWINNAHSVFSKITDEDAMNGFPILRLKTPSLSLNSMRETTNNMNDETGTIETSTGVREHIDKLGRSLREVFGKIFDQIRGQIPSEEITLGVIKRIINGQQTDSTQPNYFDILKNNELILRKAAIDRGFTGNDRFKDHPFFAFALLMNATEGDPKPVLGPIDDAVDAAAAATPVAPAAPTI